MVTRSTPATAQSASTAATSSPLSPSPTMRPLLTSGRAGEAARAQAAARRSSSSERPYPACGRTCSYRRATVEVLIPDLGGQEAALRAVLVARPAVLNHNLETVPRLYEQVRPQAGYGRSLELLRRAAAWARAASPARPLVKS